MWVFRTIGVTRCSAGVSSLARCLHTCPVLEGVTKANLSKLRKKTGFTFVNCRKALEKFENDLEQAEKWLKEQAQKEGWAKATKLQDRQTAQGLVGVAQEGTMATMVEVNCETDFVARNPKFRQLVTQVAMATLGDVKAHPQWTLGWLKALHTGEELKQLQIGDTTLGDLTALTIGTLGENIQIRRAMYYSVPPIPTKHVGVYVHAPVAGTTGGQSGSCALGKYGALVAFRRKNTEFQNFNAAELGRRLGQHVVGMSPLTVGEMPEVREEEGEKKDGDKQDEEERSTDSDEDETQMLRQTFLLDPTMTVGEMTRQQGIELLDFVRFECGEVEES
ncbi:elongation factor Ts, mitochondrial [Branchiostoma floridae]|uniref:Elongation factor Ts, mitochondrial n=1 Tax=Branchiostoma floridae TaxID=7739 RepID=A0A9J7HL26_BRAFL|nr:elongation factor Ts, mitochondrial [Branchiostoma floridae]